MKQTEEEIILKLINHLQSCGWVIESYCLGQQHGNDIVALKGELRLIIEAKGAKASDKIASKKREFFDSGQIKTHFGKALVKILEEKYKNPTFLYAIAHPNDKDIRRTIGSLTPFLKKLDIKHFWVSSDGKIEEE